MWDDSSKGVYPHQIDHADSESGVTEAKNLNPDAAGRRPGVLGHMIMWEDTPTHILQVPQGPTPTNSMVLVTNLGVARSDSNPKPWNQGSQSTCTSRYRVRV